MTVQTLPAPFAPSRISVFEHLSVLAAAITVALAWWMGVQPTARAPHCATGDRVSYAQVVHAAARVRAAETGYTAALGPALTRSRVGVPPGQVDTAARERDAARAAWARLCG